MTEALIAIVTLLLMSLFLWLSIRYFRKIRDGRIDPLVSPSWTNDMRPASPRSLDQDEPPDNPRP